MDTLLKQTLDAAVNSRFPGMDYEARKLMQEIMVRKEYKKGAIILPEGVISQNLLIVGQGMVRQFYYKNKKDVTEHFSYEGCIVICIESTLKQEPTRLIVEALEDCVLYEVPYNKLMALTEISWELNMFYRKIL